MLLGVPQALVAVERDVHSKALALESALEGADEPPVVVHHQYPHAVTVSQGC